MGGLPRKPSQLISCNVSLTTSSSGIHQASAKALPPSAGVACDEWLEWLETTFARAAAGAAPGSPPDDSLKAAFTQLDKKLSAGFTVAKGEVTPADVVLWAFLGPFLLPGSGFTGATWGGARSVKVSDAPLL